MSQWFVARTNPHDSWLMRGLSAEGWEPFGVDTHGTIYWRLFATQQPYTASAQQTMIPGNWPQRPSAVTQ